MAHYIGKFNSEQEIQQALDSGQLLKPYVAQYTSGDTELLDYNTKDAHIVVDGSVDPTAMTLSYGSTQQWITVYGDDLYWTIANTNNWITLSQDEGQGTEGVLLDIYENPVMSRTGNITVYFYTDSEKQNLKNTATLTIEQEGEGLMKPSFSDSEYIDSQSVSSASGSTNVYILNNPGSYYFKVSCDGNEVTGDSQTTAYTINYAQVDTYDDQNKGVGVEWYWDSELSDYAGEEWLTLHQAGDKSLSYIVDDGTYIPASGGTKMLEIVMNGNAVSWMLDISNAEQGISFTDYPGVTSITGNSTGVSVTVAANSNPYQKGYHVDGSFYDQYDNLLNIGYVLVRQDEYVPGTALFNNGESWMSVAASWSGDVVINITVDSGIYFDLQDGDGVSIATGDTDTSITAMTVSENTGYTPVEAQYYCHFYSDSGLTQEVSYKDLLFYQEAAPEPQGQITITATFVTASAGEVKQLVPMDALNYFDDVTYNGNSILFDLSNNWGSYQFSEAGTHQIVITTSFMSVGGWLCDSDMIECSFSANTQYGLSQGTFTGNTSLTAVTFDSNINSISSDSFSGCTALTLISCYATTAPSVNGIFDTLPGMTGTIHIPQGSDYSDWNTALDNEVYWSWTFTDDL